MKRRRFSVRWEKEPEIFCFTYLVNVLFAFDQMYPTSLCLSLFLSLSYPQSSTFILGRACEEAMPRGGAASADTDNLAASMTSSTLLRDALVARAAYTRLLMAASEQALRLVSPE